jgi:hypothetical protein
VGFISRSYIECSFTLLLKVGVEESIVNAPLVNLQIKNQTTQKVRLGLNIWPVMCNLWCVRNRLFNFDEKFKWTLDT